MKKPDATDIINALRGCCQKDDDEWNCAMCEYDTTLHCTNALREDAANLIAMLLAKLNQTGVYAKDGREILKGDKVNGLFLYAQPITGTVIFKDGSFGVEWERGGTMEFTPFTSTCNVKWEIVNDGTRT